MDEETREVTVTMTVCLFPMTLQISTRSSMPTPYPCTRARAASIRRSFCLSFRSTTSFSRGT